MVICRKKPFDIIAMTPRGTLGLCCVHIAQLMTHPAVYTLPFTFQLCYKPLGILQRVTRVKRFIYQVMIYYKNFITSNYEVMIYYKNFITWTLLDVGLQKQEFPVFPINIFDKNQKQILSKSSPLPVLNEQYQAVWYINQN